ncbi:hypothetical protein GGF31_001186 [Allomyces arbusculus]|nr:hypothetical protein GGF31_001186 [Allomyces arbusculus]
MSTSLFHTLTNVVVLALVLSTMAGTAVAQQPSIVMLTNIAAPLLTLVNAYRASVGSPPVCIVASLTAAAEAHSRDMATNQYFAHNDQNGTSPFDRMLTFGYSFNAAAENIAYGYVSPAAVMQGWIASPGHERNLRNAVYAHMGVGAAVGPCMGGQPGTTDCFYDVNDQVGRADLVHHNRFDGGHCGKWDAGLDDCNRDDCGESSEQCRANVDIRDCGEHAGCNKDVNFTDYFANVDPHTERDEHNAPKHIDEPFHLDNLKYDDPPYHHDRAAPVHHNNSCPAAYRDHDPERRRRG